MKISKLSVESIKTYDAEALVITEATKPRLRATEMMKK